jgi:hypothetical protein
MAGFAPKQPSQAEKAPEDIMMERRVLWKLDLTVLVLLGITYFWGSFTAAYEHPFI